MKREIKVDVLRETVGALSKRRHGPLLEVCGALWVFLQRLHDLTLVQHEPHELVLSLSPGGGVVKRSDELQLLQVFKGLMRRGFDHSETADGLLRIRRLVDAIQTFIMTGGSKWYMELDFLCRNFLNSVGKGDEH